MALENEFEKIDMKGLSEGDLSSTHIFEEAESSMLRDTTELWVEDVQDLDSDALDVLQQEVRQRIEVKRREFRGLVKGDFTPSKTLSEEITRILEMSTRELDILQQEIQQRLDEKRAEYEDIIRRM
ncbi:MAG: hypothetical protein ACE5PM_00350 [Candidatus Hydrothermarchaeales archaeon]